MSKLVPSHWGTVHFELACKAHDACYSKLGESKADCDARFQGEAFVACDGAFPDTRKSTLDMAGYAACGRLVALFRRAAVDFGDEAYDAAQACTEQHSGGTPVVTQQPAMLVPGVASNVTIVATDARTGAPLAGDIILDGVRVGATNQPFSYTPHLRVVAEGWHRYSRAIVGAVRVASRPSSTFVLALKRRTLVVESTPALSALAPGPIALTFAVRDAETHAPVMGMVTALGATVGSSNSPFSYTVPQPHPLPGVTSIGWCPDFWVVADGYADAPAGGNDCL